MERGGSSSVLRSAFAAGASIASASSTIATLYPPSAGVSSRNRMSPRASGTRMMRLFRSSPSGSRASTSDVPAATRRNTG